MTQPAVAEVCRACSAVHDPAKCQAHSKASGGRQCGMSPPAGASRCRKHDGSSIMYPDGNEIPPDQRIAAAKYNVAYKPVDDPLTALQDLAGRMTAWMEWIEGQVRDLKGQIRYATDGGEQIRGEIALYTQAMRDLGATLTAMGRLRIDERLVAIHEQQRDMILAAIDAGLAAAGVSGPRATDARLAIGRHLRVVQGGGSAQGQLTAG